MRLSPVFLAIAAYLDAPPCAVTALLAQQNEVPAPTNLLAVQTSPTGITLVWRVSSKDVEYVVFGPKKKADLTGRGVRLGRVSRNGSRYVTTVVAPGEEHRYSIQAVGPGGATSSRADFNVVVPVAGAATGLVAAPARVRAQLVSPGIVLVRWDAVQGATAYSLGRSVHPGGIGRLCELCDPRQTRYFDRDVTPGRVHLYTVATVSPQGRSKATRSDTLTPTGRANPDSAASQDSTPPQAPSDVTAVATTDHSITLSWKAGRGATGYEVTRRINNGEARVLIPATTRTRYVDNQATVAGKGALSYGVTSLNAAGRSEEVTVSLSDTSAVEPPKGAIGLKAGMMSPTSVQLMGSGLITGHRYSLKRRIGSNTPSIIATIGGAGTSFIDHLPSGIRDQVGYVIEDLNGKDASNEVLLTINTVAIDPDKARSDSAGPDPKGSSGLKATVVSPTSIRLTYNTSPDANFIRILRSMAGGTMTEVGRVDGSVTSFLDTFAPGGMLAGMAYTVEFLNAKGLVQKASVTIAPEKAASDSLEDKGLDSLPRVRGRIP